MVSSRMLETYCADIDNLLREGLVRAAFRTSLSLPDISAALEDPTMKSSRDRYVAWCDAWLALDPATTGRPVDGGRLFGAYMGRRSPKAQAGLTAAALARLRMSRRTRRRLSLSRPLVSPPVNRLQGFQVRLTEALIAATRRWYGERGSAAAIVQRNLGRLLVSG
jgi:hypothetical protein